MISFVYLKIWAILFPAVVKTTLLSQPLEVDSGFVLKVMFLKKIFTQLIF